MAEHLVIGSESQGFEGVGFLTGIQRLVRESHVGLVDRMSPLGVRIVPLHTRDIQRQANFTDHFYLSGDPVIHKHPCAPDDVDAFLFLDVNMQIDFSAVHRSQQLRHRPVIALVHDILPLVHSDLFPRQEILRFRLYLQQLLRLADHVVITSEKVRSDLLGLGWSIPGTLHVIPLGSVFQSRPPIPTDTDRLSLLYVSTIEPRKGHEHLISAFDLLRAEGLDIDLTLIGRAGWADPQLFDRIRLHQDFGGRLRWLESPDDVLLATVAEQCTIGVFPSQDEGYGLFLEEGLALGLKMVVSDIPVFRERTQANVHYTDLSPESIANGILTAHQQPWTSPTVPVRTMSDFLDELADLVTDVTVPPSWRAKVSRKVR